MNLVELRPNLTLTAFLIFGCSLVAVESVQAGGHPRPTWVVPVQAVPAGAPAPAGWVPVYPVLAAPAPHHFWPKHKSYLLAAPAPVAGYYYGAPAPAPAAAPAPQAAAAPAKTEAAPAPPAPPQSASTSSAYYYTYENSKWVIRRWNGSQWVEESSSSEKSTTAASPNDNKSGIGASPNASERGKLSESDQRDIVESLKKLVAARYDSSIADSIKRDALYPDAEDAYCNATKVDKDSLEKSDTTAIETLVSLALGSSPSTPAKPSATTPAQAQTGTPAPNGYYPVNFFLPMAAPSHGHSLHHGQRYYTYPY